VWVVVKRETQETLFCVEFHHHSSYYSKKRTAFNKMTTIAIVFGAFGGFSDVGKFAAVHAIRQTRPCNFRLVCLAQERTEKDWHFSRVDVKDQAWKAETKEILDKAQVTRLDVDDPQVVEKLAQEFQGCNSVLAAFANRQPLSPRYLGKGAEAITQAMKQSYVDRLVALSSFGIGEDLVPTSGIKKLWTCLLFTLLASARRDLYRMEGSIKNSGLDFLLVRTVGIDPALNPKGNYRIIETRTTDKVSVVVSKSDVALFMLEECINPQRHRVAVSISSQ